jgi:putative transposase
MNTFQLKKSGKYLVLPLKHLLTGIRQVKLILLNLHPEQDFTIKRTFIILLVSIKLLNLKNVTVTLEFLQKNKWTTSSDKKIFSNQGILIISWLQTLVLGLIGKERVLKPFWNKQCQEMSQKLWLPIEIDYVGLHSTSLNGLLHTKDANSLFSMTTLTNPKITNSQTTSCQSSTSIRVGKWEKEDTKTLLRTRKVRIYPNKKQKLQFKEWSDTSRYVYNQGLNGIKNNNESVEFYTLRDKYVTSTYRQKDDYGIYDLFYTDKYNYHIKDWEINTPKDIRAGALRDLTKAYKTCISNLKAGNIRNFNLNYRSRKKPSSIEIPKTSIKVNNGEMYIYKRYTKSKIRLSNDKCLKNLTIEYDTRLKYENGKWYLIIPIKREITSKNPKYKECGIDPGVRKFNTVYSDEMVFVVERNKDNLIKLYNKLDKLNSIRSNNFISKSKYKRKIQRLYSTLDNAIDDMHNQTIDIITSNFSKIYLPNFESQEIVKINKNRKTRRNLLQQKHFKYKTKLISKCETYNDVEVFICTEEYTSKTCTNCGVLNNPGSLEIYKCESCNIIIDRDINGARNILLKNH